METKYCKKLAEQKIFNAGYVQMWDFSRANTNQEAREEACSLVASTTRGAEESNNPAKLYERLSREAAEGKAGRVFEFIPSLYLCPSDNMNNNYMRFGYQKDGERLLYTNLRNEKTISPNEEDLFSKGNEGFISFKIKAPEFVWQQFATHEMTGRFTSRISESRRIADCKDYWRPEGITEDDMELFLSDYSLSETITYLKNFGYKKEIYQRFPQSWENRTFWICGWIQDPAVWRNVLMERGALPELWKKTWVQNETKEVAQIMRNQIEKSMPEMFKKYCGAK